MIPPDYNKWKIESRRFIGDVLFHSKLDDLGNFTDFLNTLSGIGSTNRDGAKFKKQLFKMYINSSALQKI